MPVPIELPDTFAFVYKPQETYEAAPIVEPDPVIEGKSKKKLPTLISPSGYVNGVKVR